MKRQQIKKVVHPRKGNECSIRKRSIGCWLLAMAVLLFHGSNMKMAQEQVGRIVTTPGVGAEILEQDRLASLPEQQSNNNKRRRSVSSSSGAPRKITTTNFVLHVGPPKTGTTLIQTMLEQQSQITLPMDNYAYIGNNHGILDRYTLFPCNNNKGYGGGGTTTTTSNTTTDDNNCTQVSQDFVQLLEESHQRGLNLIGSNEHFQRLTEPEMKALRTAILGTTTSHPKDRKDEHNIPIWKLHVIITYRRLHELVPSLYNQRTKVKRDEITKRPTGYHNQWPGSSSNNNNNNNSQEQDSAIPSFQDHFLKNFQRDGHWWARLPTSYTYSIWSNMTRDISIFSIHDGPQDEGRNHNNNNMPTRFVCQMIPHADHTCHNMHDQDHFMSTRNKGGQGGGGRKKEKNRLNLSRPLDYDILAVAAYEKGWIHPSFKRRRVAMDIQDFHESSHTHSQQDDDFYSSRSLPETCLEPHLLDTLYNKSLQEERWVMSFEMQSEESRRRGGRKTLPQLTPEQQMDFDQSWDTALRSGKFCSVNAQETLQLDHWKHFFLSRYSNNNATTISTNHTTTIYPTTMVPTTVNNVTTNATNNATTISTNTI